MLYSDRSLKYTLVAVASGILAASLGGNNSE